ncbi:MAG TPA: GntR family transcriptional regulator [Epulopiscium sp.]|nr:GntR family transcriptional regulator [Candidatus Epulonipiscium sp.]
MLIKIDFESENPIYMQLKEQLIEGIARGELVAGKTLPSVRQLAEDIGINLHTVNKTYNILKVEGYLTVDRRKGAMVNEIPHEYDENKQDELRRSLSGVLAQMHCKGIKRETIDQWIGQDFQGFNQEEGE